MLRGFTASVLLHAGVVASSLIALPYAREPADIIEVVPIDIVTISEVTNVRAVRERITELPPADDAPEELVEEEPEIEDLPEDLDVPPEDLPEANEDVLPPPAPEKEEAPEDIVPEELEKEEPKPEPKKPEPEPEKDDKPKRDALDDLLDSNLFDPEKAPLLDRAAPQVQKRAPPPTKPVLPAPPKKETSQLARRGAGDRTGNEARIEALIWSQMRVCWGTVADLKDPERLTVTVRVTLNRDGTLKGDVELLNPRRRPIGDRFMGQAIDRALRAARKCQPYTFPGDDYEIWNEITMNFRHQRQD